MTDPSQYFKGRTVQEQMNEVIGYIDTRAAEVATDAIAADVAQVHQDMLDADADATAAAASAAAAAGTLANAVKKTGEASQSIAGDVAVAGALSGGSLGTSGNLAVGGTGAFTGAVTGPTEATGTFSTKLATSDKVKNELDAYAPMLRTTGNQTKGGTFTLNPNAQIPFTVQRPSDDLTQTPTSNQYSTIAMTDSNNVQGLTITRAHYTNSQTQLLIGLRGQSGNYATLTLTLNSNDTGSFSLKKPDGTSVTLASW